MWALRQWLVQKLVSVAFPQQPDGSRQRRELTAQNKQLQEDLVKREEALKRLRELTLGRTGSTQ